MMRSSCVAAALLVLVCGLVQAQEQNTRGRRGGGFGGTTMLLASPTVQTELKLTDEQKEKVKGLSSGYAALRDLPREERDKKMQELAAENKKKVDEILNNEQ